MKASKRLAKILPAKVLERVDPYLEAVDIVGEMRDPRVLAAIGPSAARGMILKRGKQGVPTEIPARHRAWFDWRPDEAVLEEDGA